MLDKKIKEITYNHLNLPTAVYVTPLSGSSTTVSHIYRTDGAKVFKKSVQGTTVITTDYLDDFQYEHSSLQPTVSDLKFVSTAEGYFSFENNKYIYQYKDQVGNIRVSFFKDSSGNAVIDKATDYYPFGLEHQNGVNPSLTPSYKYGFQEQEKQEETGWSSFKWRNYDPSIGRFFNVDPLSEKYAYQSHYNFSENAVINARELEGLEKVIVLGGESAVAGAAAKGSTKTGAYSELKRYAQRLASEGSKIQLMAFGAISYGVAKVLKSEDNKDSKAKTSDSKGSDAKSADDKQKTPAEERAERLSKKERPGKDFTKAGKEAVKDLNKEKNNGKTVCENCGIETVPGKKSEKGVTPPNNETQVDHVKRKREGGSGTPNNGQVLCRGCNLDKH